MRYVLREMGMSTSGKALAEFLDSRGADDAAAMAIRGRFHYTVLWRYKTGRGKPNAGNVAWLEQITGGAVPASGWADLPEDDEDCATAKSKEPLIIKAGDEIGEGDAAE